MQLQLTALEKSHETMANMSIEIIGKLMDKDTSNGFRKKLEKFLKEN
jgi:hypothetical protein